MKSFKELGFYKEWDNENRYVYDKKEDNSIFISFAKNRVERPGIWYWQASSYRWFNLDIALAIAVEQQTLNPETEVKTLKDLGFKLDEFDFNETSEEDMKKFTHYFNNYDYKGTGKVKVCFNPRQKEWDISGWGDFDTDLINAIIVHLLKIECIKPQELEV